MPSGSTVEQAIEMRRQLTEVGDKASFHIRKWISNQPEVIADLFLQRIGRQRLISIGMNS